jgi:DNA topoisomerase-2
MTTTKPKSIEDKFKKLSQKEHLLLRPGMYIGKIFDEVDDMWVLSDKGGMVRKGIKYNPGLLKLFDEIILNALDQFQESDLVTEIDVVANADMVSIRNNGPGIPIVKHKEHNVWIPEMIFSQFLTSTNYNDDEVRLKSGLNGLGAKITSSFSRLFQVETVSQGKIYQQNFLNNLDTLEEPLVGKTKSKDYTKITFFPDFKRFKVKNITPSTMELFKKRTYDIAAFSNKNIKITFNGAELGVNSFSDYVDLFLPTKELRAEKVILETPRWKIAISSSPFDSFTQVSFVNGIDTRQGGTHIKYIIDPVIKQILEKYQKKIKDTPLRPSFLRDNMFVVVLASIENPGFESQAKEELTTKPNAFGSTMVVDDATMKKIEKMSMVSKMMEFARFKESRALAATDGKKKCKISGIPKLDDANFAGTNKSEQCTLIVTEGDSAKTFAVSGLNPQDRNLYGIFPLKGKVLNVRDATSAQILKNQEIINLKLILGLQNGKQFKTISDLKKTMRYGSILILTDSDVDGFHIKGLLINFFHFFWPLLVIEDDFITCLRTPVVKATKGKVVESFYTVPEYTKWKEQNKGTWKIKYYKGLGTSSSREAKDCFNDMGTKKLFYRAPVEGDEDAIRLAFQRDRSNDRKDWIQTNSGKEIYLGMDQKNVSVSEFVNRELILFSIEDCERSIPNIMDGFKPSQRKVIYSGILKNTKEEMKVDQFRGFVGEKTAYHHGDMSLNETIVNLNHDYVGSNNINFLLPCGQLGTRLMGGKDAASARYISTKVNPLTHIVFNKQDNFLLEYIDDDGYTIEPRFYYPIIPTILVNGTSGIGTGYSTDIPKFNPFDIIKNVRGLIANDSYEIKELVPWYRNFLGTVGKNEKTGKWYTQGTWVRVDRATIRITELPVGKWTDDYKAFLDALVESRPELDISEVKDYKTEQVVNFEITAQPLLINTWIESNMVEEIFKLRAPVKENLVMFDYHGKIRQYDSPESILYEFFSLRKEKYVLRYEDISKTLAGKIEEINTRMVFIRGIIEGTIKVFMTPKVAIVKYLTDNKFKKVDGSYEYLLNIKIHQFTKEQIEKLQEELDDFRRTEEGHKTKSPKDLWVKDLDDLEVELKKFYK